jgi:hypothetical protein
MSKSNLDMSDMVDILYDCSGHIDIISQLFTLIGHFFANGVKYKIELYQIGLNSKSDVIEFIKEQGYLGIFILSELRMSSDEYIIVYHTIPFENKVLDMDFFAQILVEIKPRLRSYKLNRLWN